MKIAIIGSGISGLTAAHLLHGDFDITLFEANDYPGGHAHTVTVEREHGVYQIDTAFIVFNETTYPNFSKMLKKLGVPSQAAKMSFSVKSEKNSLEYNVHSLNTIFSQRKNILNPSFYRLIFDTLRFRRQFDELPTWENNDARLLPYLEQAGYSKFFIDYFIVPLASSLWSAPPGKLRDFPLIPFVRFCKNHLFFNIKKQLPWRVIKGGSQNYVEKLITPFKPAIRTGCPVRSITRHHDHVQVISRAGEEKFDQVILAAHSDQALAMLNDPSAEEQEILGAMPYQHNRVHLHVDPSILPAKKSIRASWNHLIPAGETELATLTYDMNILQSITAPEEFCVTLNRRAAIDPAKIIAAFDYAHPVYLATTPRNQQRHAEISGVNRTHYCGAYWGYGFHEDGVNSALAVCRFFGKTL